MRRLRNATPAGTGGGRAANRLAPPSWRSGHTIVVGALKIGLPLIAVGLVLLVILWPRLFPARSVLDPRESVFSGGDDVAMTDPRYVGRDAQDRPFAVRAEEAHRGSQRDAIYLAAPHGTITLDGGRSLAARAESGHYDEEAKVLDLDGNVTVRHSSGYVLHTSTATLNLDKAQATTERPVAGHGPAGTIHAGGMRVLDGGETVIFTGTSQLVLNAAAGNGDSG